MQAPLYSKTFIFVTRLLAVIQDIVQQGEAQ